MLKHLYRENKTTNLKLQSVEPNRGRDFEVYHVFQEADNFSRVNKCPVYLVWLDHAWGLFSV